MPKVFQHHETVTHMKSDDWILQGFLCICFQCLPCLSYLNIPNNSTATGVHLSFSMESISYMEAVISSMFEHYSVERSMHVKVFHRFSASLIHWDYTHRCRVRWIFLYRAWRALARTSQYGSLTLMVVTLSDSVIQVMHFKPKHFQGIFTTNISEEMDSLHRQARGFQNVI